MLLPLREWRRRGVSDLAGPVSKRTTGRWPITVKVIGQGWPITSDAGMALPHFILDRCRPKKKGSRATSSDDLFNRCVAVSLPLGETGSAWDGKRQWKSDWAWPPRLFLCACNQYASRRANLNPDGEVSLPVFGSGDSWIEEVRCELSHQEASLQLVVV
jgi:hypothetical protein